jgi:O-antigen/teichoic acid export membrane protein
LIGRLRSNLWRRSATAAGIYLSVGFGFLGTLFAARQLSVEEFGLLSVVIVATGFFQSLLDLTAEEALVKYGFDYSTAEDWGRLRRLFRTALAIKALGGLAAGIVLVALAPAADAIFGGDGLETPFLIAAVLPLAQSPEGVSSAALIIRSRYDVRAWFLACSMGLRMVGLAVGAHFGVTDAVIGVVAAQVVATALLGGAGLAIFRRFPQGVRATLGEHRRRILGFVAQSSVATGVVSLRTAVSPLLLGIVTAPEQVGYFRIAQAPMQGLASLSAPARLILLAEQTRDWSRGAFDTVFAGIRRYTIGATLVMLVIVPPLFVFMPELIRLLYGSKYEGATDAARLILVAGALQLTASWSKSFPVSIGRPGLRVLAHGIETAVLIPLVVIFGSIWGATGAGAAVLVSSVVFCGVWFVLLLRIRRGGSAASVAPEPAPREAVPL